MDHLSRAHMSSQGLKCQPHCQHGSVPGPLHTCYDCCPVALVGAAVSLTLLPVLETLFHILGALSNLDMRAFALTYCILFCPVWLVCLGANYFLKRSVGEVKW